jgi:hypothetical protein
MAGEAFGWSEFGFGVGAGVATTAGEASIFGWSEFGFGVGAGVATTAGEASIFGLFEFGVGNGAGVATTAGEASIFDLPEFGVGVGVAMPAASGSASGWSALGVGSGAAMIAGLRTPARLLDSSSLSFAVESPGLSFAVESPGLSSAAGAAIVDGIGVVFASEPTGCTAAGCESASAGAPTVATVGTGLSASARASLTAPRGVNSRKVKTSRAATHSRRRPSIANSPTFLMARSRAKAGLTLTNHGSSTIPRNMYSTA